MVWFIFFLAISTLPSNATMFWNLFFFPIDVMCSHILWNVFSVMFTQILSLVLGIWIQKVHFSMEITEIPCPGLPYRYFCKIFHCFCSFHSCRNMSTIEFTGNFLKKIWVLSRMFLLTSGRIMKVRVQSKIFYIQYVFPICIILIICGCRSHCLAF